MPAFQQLAVDRHGRLSGLAMTAERSRLLAVGISQDPRSPLLVAGSTANKKGGASGPPSMSLEASGKLCVDGLTMLGDIEPLHLMGLRYPERREHANNLQEHERTRAAP
jgi:hypothetical protein